MDWHARKKGNELVGLRKYLPIIYHFLSENTQRYFTLLVGAITFVVFLQALRYGFSIFGDAELLSNESLYTLGLGKSGLLAATQVATPWNESPGPLAAMSHMLDFQLFRNSAPQHHLTSIWLHISNTVLFFAVVKELIKSLWIAAMAAVLFSLHPIQAPPVVWIIQRQILLATLFVLTTVLWWVRYKRTGKVLHYIFSVIAFCCSMLCYFPSGAMVFTLLILECYPVSGEHRYHADNHTCRAIAHAILWMIGVAALFVTGRMTMQFDNGDGLDDNFLSGEGTWVIDVVSIFALLTRSLWETIRLGNMFPISILDSSNVSAINLGPALLAFLLVYIAWRARSAFGNRILAGLVWFISCASAAVFFARKDASVPIHWVYLAYPGLAFMVACVVIKVLGRFGFHRATRICFSLVVFLLAWLTHREIKNWDGIDKIANRILANNPDRCSAWRIWNTYGINHDELRNPIFSRICYRRALNYRFDSRTLLRLGYLEWRVKAYGRAKLYFQTVIREKLLISKGHAALGAFSKEFGDLTEAARHFDLALNHDSNNVAALTGLAMIYASASDSALRNGRAAIYLANRALRLTDEHELQSMIACAAAHAEMGEFEIAQKLEQRAWAGALRVGSTNVAMLCKRRLEFYKQHKPWREDPRITGSIESLPAPSVAP